MPSFVTMYPSLMQQHNAHLLHQQLLLITLFGLLFFPSDKFSSVHGSCLNQGLVASNSSPIPFSTTHNPCINYGNYTPPLHQHPHHHHHHHHHPYNSINPHHPAIYGPRTGYGYQNPNSPYPPPVLNPSLNPPPLLNNIPSYPHNQQVPERLNFPDGYRPPVPNPHRVTTRVTTDPIYFQNQLPPPPVGGGYHPHVPVPVSAPLAVTGPVRGSYSYPTGYTGPGYYSNHPHTIDYHRYQHHLPHQLTHQHQHQHQQHHPHPYPHPQPSHYQGYPAGIFQRRTFFAEPSTIHAPHDPIFLGRGAFGIIEGRDVELVCDFHEPRFRIVSVSYLKD